MHPKQIEILESLRQGESRKFSALLSDVAETSDNLTYHLKRLQQADLIESPAKGEYSLAQQGIIYLNNNLELNHDLFPTVSCMLQLTDAGGNILVMKKLKQPYLGTIHLPTFGVTSEHDLNEQVQLFLEKYHIAAEDIAFKCNYRERVHDTEGILIFDKLFLVYSGVLTDYEDSVQDREFSTSSKAGIMNDQNALPATKDVLGLGGNTGLVETIRQS